MLVFVIYVYVSLFTKDKTDENGYIREVKQ